MNRPSADIAVTQDGRIMKRPRKAMNDPVAIVHFMAKDITAQKLPPDSDDWSGLQKAGWTASQCRQHFRAAMMQAHQDSALTLGRDALALLSFLAFIIAACVQMGGAA